MPSWYFILFHRLLSFHNHFSHFHLGEAPVVIYVGGIPSNKDKSFLFLKNGKGRGIRNDIIVDPNFEEGFPKYNPQTFDWEYVNILFFSFVR